MRANGRARRTAAGSAVRRRARPGHVALERALSKLGLASRTEARAMVVAGRVAMDGHVVVDPGMPVVPERVRLTIDGVATRASTRVVVLLHKPRGVVTTRSDPRGRPTVYSCLTGLDERVVPVGRLDLATSGLLLLTNDTRLADWLTDPQSGIAKVYLVTVRGRVTDDEVARLREGVTDRGETLTAADATVRKASARESHLVLTLTEGRNREVRRLCDAIGHEVTRLRRVQVGGLALGTLAPGRWRLVAAEELARAFPRYASSSAPSPR